MRKLDVLRLCLLFVAVAAFFILPKTVEGPFEVVDGDTLKKEGKYFRAYYIDAPELSSQKPWVLAELSNETCLKNVAEEARLFAYGVSRVSLKGKKDKYGRELAEFLAPEGTSLEMEMVARGLARCYYRKPKLEDPKVSECLERESEAKRLLLGMWACG